MRYKRLGKTDINASVLACGSNDIYYGTLTQERLKETFNYALDKGINLFVTSAYYLIAEEMIYKAIGDRRDEFYIATTTDYRTGEKAERDIENSFRHFNTDYIDIYMIGGVRKIETIGIINKEGNVLSVLRKYRKKRKIGHIGITGHMPEALARAITVAEDIDVVLFILNMTQIGALRSLIPVAKQHDVGLMAMQALAHGYLHPVNKALRFCLASPADVVVVGMSSIQEIDENIKIAEPTPTEREWSTLLKEAEPLAQTGCNQCRQCVGWYLRKSLCPADIDIPFVINIFRWRERFGLTPRGEKKWLTEIEKCKQCKLCEDRRCEKACPENIKIINLIQQIVKSAKTDN